MDELAGRCRGQVGCLAADHNAACYSLLPDAATKRLAERVEAIALLDAPLRARVRKLENWLVVTGVAIFVLAVAQFDWL